MERKRVKFYGAWKTKYSRVFLPKHMTKWWCLASLDDTFVLFQMTVPFRLEVTVVVAVLACACSYGMKIDFSRLTHLRRTPLIAHKRGSECTGRESVTKYVFFISYVNKSPTSIHDILYISEWNDSLFVSSECFNDNAKLMFTELKKGIHYCYHTNILQCTFF